MSEISFEMAKMIIKKYWKENGLTQEEANFASGLIKEFDRQEKRLKELKLNE